MFPIPQQLTHIEIVTMNAPRSNTLRFLVLAALCLAWVQGFLPSTTTERPKRTTTTTTFRLHGMKRPLLDQVASTLFNLETERVRQSSETDEKGRVGEPMAWSRQESWANRFSQLMATGPAYVFKQWVADIVAGEYDPSAVNAQMDDLIQNNEIAMFSFTTCPFCRRAKDALDERGIPYRALELDELDGNRGNEIRAQLGRRTGRTSVPSIFVRGNFIGGCNDGPGLLPFLESGELERMLKTAATTTTTQV